MLFDLQGKRRRVVQATYLTLAVLMGGGLVLFGIGGEVQGGLFDAFSGSGGDDGNEAVEERVERNEDRVESTPRDEDPRKQLVRDYYQLAVAQAPGASFPDEAKDELRRASVHWNAYLEIEKDAPDASLAQVALQVYNPTALNDPAAALEAARIVARSGRDAGSYLQLVRYAAQAGDRRTEKQAIQKALELAPQGQRKAVRAQVKEIQSQILTPQELKRIQAQQQGSQGGGAGGGK